MQSADISMRKAVHPLGVGESAMALACGLHMLHARAPCGLGEVWDTTRTGELLELLLLQSLHNVASGGLRKLHL